MGQMWMTVRYKKEEEYRHEAGSKEPQIAARRKKCE